MYQLSQRHSGFDRMKVDIGSSLPNMRVMGLRSGGKSHTKSSREGRDLNKMISATALSQIPPKTNVRVLDDYYKSFNTQGQIDSIKFVTEFERLLDKVEKYWKLQETPIGERKKVREILALMKERGLSQ